MCHGHAQDGQLVWFPRQRRTRRHHVRQFGNVGGHLVAPAAFNFAVILARIALLVLALFLLHFVKVFRIMMIVMI